MKLASLAALAAVTFVAWFALLQSHQTPPETGYSSPVTTANPPPTTTAPVEPTSQPANVAFLGDSYTSGTGADSVEDRWTSLLSADAGWSEANFGWGGTGYVAAPIVDGIQRTPYAARVEQIVNAAPSLIIISGGRNDIAEDPAAVRLAAFELFNSLKSELPEAEIVVISPWWDSTAAPAGFESITQSVRDAADEAGVQFVDTGAPLADPSLLSDDGVHPNNEGHAAIAEAVAAALR